MDLQLYLNTKQYLVPQIRYICITVYRWTQSSVDFGDDIGYWRVSTVPTWLPMVMDIHGGWMMGSGRDIQSSTPHPSEGGVEGKGGMRRGWGLRVEGSGFRRGRGGEILIKTHPRTNPRATPWWRGELAVVLWVDRMPPDVRVSCYVAEGCSSEILQSIKLIYIYIL